MAILLVTRVHRQQRLSQQQRVGTDKSQVEEAARGDQSDETVSHGAAAKREGERAACTSSSMRTTPSTCHAHRARAAQLVHMLNVSRNLWQEGSMSCGCTQNLRLVVVVTIHLRPKVQQ